MFSSNQHANTVLNHLLTGVLVVDTQFRCVFANATAEQILSASMAQILNTDILSILAPVNSTPNLASSSTTPDKSPAPKADKKSKNETKASLQQQFENTYRMHQAFLHHDCLIQGIQQSVLVDYGISPFESDLDFFYIVELWAKDRQSRIHQEQQQQAQHHVTRQLIRSMAHEVKNPLAGIYGASQLLQKYMAQLLPTDKTDTPIALSPEKIQAKAVKVQNYLAIIMDETQRLNNLVTQLLGLPKLPQWQLVNIHEPIEHVLALIGIHQQDIRFIKDYDLSLPEITADKDQLIQVFLNLINNAVQALTEHSVENPTITIQTRIEHQHTIGDIRHKNVLKINIMDNGMGIAPEFLPQIFYPLVTGRANGTGLGLALVHDILQRHHGMIDVQSQPHKTVFSVYVPFQNTA